MRQPALLELNDLDLVDDTAKAATQEPLKRC